MTLFSKKVTLVAWLVGAGVVLSMLLGGCGGGGLVGLTPTPDDDAQPAAGQIGAAKFHVDVPSGKVTVTPIGSNKTGTKAVLGSNAVTLTSTDLLNQPGDVGRRSIRISAQYRGDESYFDQRLLLSNFTNLASMPDRRSQTVVSTIATLTGESNPRAICFDPAGTAYIVDSSTNRLWRRDAGGLQAWVGSGSAGYNDGGAASAQFNGPESCVFANVPFRPVIIVADTANHRLRLVDTDGNVSTLAGCGSAGISDGYGTGASFRRPTGLAVSGSGTNVYVADTGNHSIRVLGVMSPSVLTIAGSGGFVGAADGIGLAARFNGPRGLALAKDERYLYVADTNNNKIRAIDLLRYSVTTIAGTGAAGTADGRGDTATFSMPIGITALSPTMLAVADGSGHTIRILTRTGPSMDTSSWQVQTIAGLGGSAGSTDGNGSVARFNLPLQMTTGGALAGPMTRTDKVMYVADYSNRAIRKISIEGWPLTSGAASGGTSEEPVRVSNADFYAPGSGDEGTPAFGLGYSPMEQQAEVWFVIPNGVEAFEFTAIVQAETGRLAPPEAGNGGGSANVSVRTFSGSTSGNPGFQDGNGASARFGDVCSIAVGGPTGLCIADRANHAIRSLWSDGDVRTLAGFPGLGAGAVDGPVSTATFNSPYGVAPFGGYGYVVADTLNHTIRIITSERGMLSAAAVLIPPTPPVVGTIAGAAGVAGYADGSGEAARFSAPEGICVDSEANTVFVSEYGGNRIRRLQYRGAQTPEELVKPGNWHVSLLAGSTSGAAGFVNGRATAVRFNGPTALARSEDGILYVADMGNHVIRKLIVDGGVSTLAGSGSAGYADGSRAAARFNAPRGVAVDRAGYVYVADSNSNRVRRVSPSGAVATIAGTGVAGGADGRGDTATFRGPRACAVDYSGNLYVSDGQFGERIRVIERIINP